MKSRKPSKSIKKLTPQDFADMWGEDGPYSQVRLSVETRILDDSVSRVFLVVEAEINPFTYRIIKANLKEFDKNIASLIEHCEDRGRYGFIVGGGTVEFNQEGAWDFALKQSDILTEEIILMHSFVIKKFGLSKGAVASVDSPELPLVWNSVTGRVEVVGLSDSGPRARRCFVVPLAKAAFLEKELSKILADSLKAVVKYAQAVIIDVSIQDRYLFIETDLPENISPNDFIGMLMETVEGVAKKKVFLQGCLVTDSRPDVEQIVLFLKQVDLIDKNEK